MRPFEIQVQVYDLINSPTPIAGSSFATCHRHCCLARSAQCHLHSVSWL